MTTSSEAAVAHFRAVAPKFMRRLHSAFPQLDEDDLAAIFGNAGHESKGLTDDQEDKPVVKGSRGGANWAQWTGPRRRALEAFAKAKGLDPDGDEAAFQFLVTELKGDEKRAIPAVMAAVSLDDKVKAFEKAFLRAGVKHYPSRLKWAQIALLAYRKASAAPVPAPRPADELTAQQVMDIQERLRALGYHEVGAIDGIIGPATENAILIFRKDHNLPLSTRIDGTLRDALLKASPRTVADSRANADAKDVREQAPEARASWWSKIGAMIGAVFTGIVGMFHGTTLDTGEPAVAADLDDENPARNHLRCIMDWIKPGSRGRIFWCDDDETQTVDLSGYSSGTDVLGDPITLSASYQVGMSPVFCAR